MSQHNFNQIGYSTLPTSSNSQLAIMPSSSQQHYQMNGNNNALQQQQHQQQQRIPLPVEFENALPDLKIREMIKIVYKNFIDIYKIQSFDCTKIEPSIYNHQSNSIIPYNNNNTYYSFDYVTFYEIKSHLKNYADKINKFINSFQVFQGLKNNKNFKQWLNFKIFI